MVQSRQASRVTSGDIVDPRPSPDAPSPGDDAELLDLVHDAILRIAPDPVFLLSADGRCLYASPAALETLGVPPESLLGRLWDTLDLPSGVREMFGQRFAEMRAKGRPVNAEDSFAVGGNVRTFEYVLSPLMATDGTLAAVVVTGRDVTDRRRATEAHGRPVQERVARVESEAAEPRVSTILEGNASGFFALDEAWSVVDVNGQAERLLKKSREEMLGRCLWDILPEATGTAFDQQCRRAVAERVSVSFVVHFAPQDAWLDVKAYPSDGGLSVYLRDVSRERLSADLLHERAWLDALIEQMPGGVLVAEAPSGRIVRGNRQIEHMLRHPILSSPSVEAYGEWKGFHADGRPVLPHEWPLARAVVAGETVIGEELEYLRGDGTRAWIAANAAPLRDAKGEIHAAVATFYDVDAQKRAEERASREAGRVRFLADVSRAMAEAHLDVAALVDIVVTRSASTLGDGAVLRLVSDDGHSLEPAGSYHHDGKAAGWIRDTFARKAVAIGEGFQGKLAMQHGALRIERLERRGEEMLEDSDDRSYVDRVGIASVLSAPLRTRERTIGTLLVVRDLPGEPFDEEDELLIEDLADRAALALEDAGLYRVLCEAIQVRDEFLSIASHELRTPVTAIKAAAQFMRRSHQRGTLDADRFERSLRNLEEGSQRLRVLTEDLLDVSRLQTGRLGMHAAPMDVVALLRRLTETHAAQLPSSQELRLEVESWCNVMGDETRMEQVLANLLGNASKYSPTGGTIRITLSTSDDGCLIQVRDEGMGLPPGTEELIFEPFGRARNATEENLPGMGLGLYISRQIVERHGGRIWAESPGEHQGTTMSVWLPTLQTGEEGSTELA